MKHEFSTVDQQTFNDAWDALAVPVNAVDMSAIPTLLDTVTGLWEVDGLMLKSLSSGERMMQTNIGLPFGLLVSRPMATTVDVFGKHVDVIRRISRYTKAAAHVDVN